MLEIGTGWGGFALYAAGELGCRVTTLTISQAQHDLARERIAEAGLDDLVTVELRDYRDITGTYDAVVSIEMLEAVGAEYYGDYFAAELAPSPLLHFWSLSVEEQFYLIWPVILLCVLRVRSGRRTALIGTIGACLAAGIRVWDRARSFNVLENEAVMGLELMERDLRNRQGRS